VPLFRRWLNRFGLAAKREVDEKFLETPELSEGRLMDGRLKDGRDEEAERANPWGCAAATDMDNTAMTPQRESFFAFICLWVSLN